MQIFLSWSGDESRAVAHALKNWLPLVIQSAKPYMSADDNVAGARWGDIVNSRLQDSQFGIICLTPSNLDARWLLYEAGALGKMVGTSHVVPFLHSLTPSDVKPPLAQFMMKESDKEGVRDVLTAINQEIASPLEDSVLDQTFEAMWPKLKDELAKTPAPSRPAKARRSERDLLEEVLDLVRLQSRSPIEQEHSDYGHLLRAEYSEARTREEITYFKKRATEAETQLEDGASRMTADLLMGADIAKGQLRRRGGALVVRTSAPLDGSLRDQIERGMSYFGLKAQFETI